MVHRVIRSSLSWQFDDERVKFLMERWNNLQCNSTIFHVAALNDRTSGKRRAGSVSDSQSFECSERLVSFWKYLNASAPRFPLRSVPRCKCECHRSSRRSNLPHQGLFRRQSTDHHPNILRPQLWYPYSPGEGVEGFQLAGSLS